MYSCPACGSRRTAPTGSYRHKHTSFGGLTLRGCETCGLVFAAPMPSEAALTAYNARYYDTAHGGQQAQESAQCYHSAINRVRLAHVLAYCARVGVDPASVLEVGPGHGFFARHFLDSHPTATYVAVESDIACRSALAIHGIVSYRDLAELPPDRGPFDLVVMSHVLEHVTAPREFLSAFVARMRPGAVLFIEVPCRDDQHKRIEEPHLLFFDKPAMSRLLESIGAATLALSYHGTPLAKLKSPIRRLATRLWRRVTRFLGRPAATMTAMPPMFSDPALGDEWRAIARSQAHCTWDEPAWWLRALATAPSGRAPE